MSDLAFMADLTMSDLALIFTHVTAAFFCCMQIVRFARLAEEFTFYTAENQLTSAGILHALFDHTGLDEHQKILRAEAAFSAATMVLPLGWLLVTIALTW